MVWFWEKGIKYHGDHLLKQSLPPEGLSFVAWRLALANVEVPSVYGGGCIASSNYGFLYSGLFILWEQVGDSCHYPLVISTVKADSNNHSAMQKPVQLCSCLDISHGYCLFNTVCFNSEKRSLCRSGITFLDYNSWTENESTFDSNILYCGLKIETML